MKNRLRMVAFGAVVAVAASTVPSMASAIGFAGVQDQDQNHGQNHHNEGQQHSDYSNNPYYTQGNREGYNDYRHKKHKMHHHKFHNDADRQAYDEGYRQGLQGQQAYPDNNNPHQ